MIGLKREYNLVIRVLALAAVLAMVPMSWKGRLLFGGTGLLTLIVWYRSHR